MMLIEVEDLINMDTSYGYMSNTNDWSNVSSALWQVQEPITGVASSTVSDRWYPYTVPDALREAPSCVILHTPKGDIRLPANNIAVRIDNDDLYADDTVVGTIARSYTVEVNVPYIPHGGADNNMELDELVEELLDLSK